MAKPPTNFLSVKMYKSTAGQRPLRFCPAVAKKFTPKAQYTFLRRDKKEAVDAFDVAALHYFMKAGNLLNVFWIMGIITDRIDKFPDAPVSESHQAVLEEFQSIYKEWDYLINCDGETKSLSQ